MDISEFLDATLTVLKNGDVKLAKQLEGIAREKNDPYYYSNLGFMYEPIESASIEYENKKVIDSQIQSTAAVCSELLENLDNLQEIKSGVSSQYYYSLALKGFKELADNGDGDGDADAMSAISDMYGYGMGIAVDPVEAKYWLDRCYLTKYGMTFDKWKKGSK